MLYNQPAQMQTAQQEGVPGAPPPLAQEGALPGPNIHWVGPPMYIHNDIPHYKAANIAGQQISIGEPFYIFSSTLRRKA